MTGTSVSLSNPNGKVIVVAVKVCKEISKNSLVWALTHIVQPGDSILLLVVLPDYSSSKKMWDIVRLTGDCANLRPSSGSRIELKNDVTELCTQMISELHTTYNHLKFEISVRVICGGVFMEVKNAKANWVILDKHFKQEKKSCMEELDCNVVEMNKTKPKVLRLNLTNSIPNEKDPSMLWTLHLESSSQREDIDSLKGPYVTPATSPEHELSFNGTDVGASSISSSEPGGSPFLPLNTQKIKIPSNHDDNRSLYDSESEHETTKELLCWNLIEAVQKHSQQGIVSTCNGFSPSREFDASSPSRSLDFNVRKSLREAISLCSNTPLGPPPLCSLCRHKSPAFGNPPRWFSYSELENATNGFAGENFLAEGGFGSVHRGVLSDGQMVAVKQHRLASSQGDLEFCSEVEVLSCAQHRNVVTLIGLCIEEGKRLLVYEYICNGSLDARLFGQGRPVLEWSARQKIAVGASRGLRYLHEECRVGCIVHRDMRPNNILITHDFEPLVGDFGLARWQPDGDKGVETRVLGTFGYLAPEYAQSGQVTEKADVYSFGVVLLELVTGKKAIDLNRPKGQQCLTEWARPLMTQHCYDELVDPRLGSRYSVREVHNMLRCSSLCIQRDPIPRPRISQVLRMLEGYVVITS